ncbi:alpha/beta hydrolase [Mycolicibacter sp. MYC123]|uniref:Alpha/beta hydrolase n=1 Tax=[Mycobacterium] zoologicum TaxID=2872311 RepID=A0ABU5YFV2_9MYCO|nr:alpha/beta hydrolase [Mycolicibacter sp. MYC123]MEB3048670.1 alpha/beta hydrolase [Mycolicibacter sp. MYC123]
MSELRGAHVQAARMREAALAGAFRSAADTDRLLTATLHDAADHARVSRRRLDAIGAEITDAVSDVRVWDSPAGARQLQLFLAAKARDIRAVISDAVSDARSRTTMLRCAGDGYGVPAAERDRINRQALAADIDRVRNATEAISAEDMRRYDNAMQVLDGLRVSAETGPALLLIYDPAAFEGRGRAAIAIGDPDTADNTTVLVPGAHCSVRDGYLSQPDGVNVYREACHADPDRSNSVIVWMGYRTPDSLLDSRVAHPDSARAGGRSLAADVNALALTHRGAAHVTVIGHSYGSTTVADAAVFGMRADDVVLVGSPGTDLARSATDFHLPPAGHVYVGASSADPITRLGGQPQLSVPATSATVGLGADPAADGYGATRFKAEVGGLASPMRAHSSYFRPGGESLFSIGDIASGHGDALARDHMTALHRRRLPAFEPERLRLGSGNHRH